MKKYTTIKTVYATPMIFGEFAEIVPGMYKEPFYKSVEGYLITNKDGYSICWKSKESFEAEYSMVAELLPEDSHLENEFIKYLDNSQWAMFDIVGQKYFTSTALKYLDSERYYDWFNDWLVENGHN